jgi:hypothetical protein
MQNLLQLTISSEALAFIEIFMQNLLQLTISSEALAFIEIFNFLTG